MSYLYVYKVFYEKFCIFNSFYIMLENDKIDEN